MAAGPSIRTPQEPTLTGDDVITQLGGKRYGLVRLGTERDAGRWRAAVRDANARQLLGPDLHIRTRRQGEVLTFGVSDGPNPSGLRSQRDRQPVPVPERLTRRHPLVAALGDGVTLGATRPVRSRALRILQALIVEAERRGMTATPATVTAAELCLGRGAHQYPVTIREETNRVPREPSARERRDAERDSWDRIPDFDSVPSGRLVIELHTTYRGDRRRWADGKRWRLEDKLDDILIEIDA